MIFNHFNSINITYCVIMWKKDWGAKGWTVRRDI